MSRGVRFAASYKACGGCFSSKGKQIMGIEPHRLVSIFSQRPDRELNLYQVSPISFGSTKKAVSLTDILDLGTLRIVFYSTATHRREMSYEA